MRFVLIKAEISGIKNIEKNITIKFAQESINRNLNVNQSFIKGIYGANGSGKSAIINAFNIYKSLCLDDRFLLKNESVLSLKRLINKKAKDFFISCYFGIADENGKLGKILCHSIEVDFSGTNPIIKGEELSQCIGTSINSKAKPIASYANFNECERIIYSSKTNIDGICLKEIEKSISVSSFISIFSNAVFQKKIYDEIKRNNSVISESSLFDSLFMTYSFATNLKIYLDNEDVHQMHIGYDIPEFYFLLSKEERNRYMFKREIMNSDVIKTDDIKDFEKDTDDLCNFIKLFKPELKSILLDKRYDMDECHIKKEFDYGEYLVDLEYESTGIKKLTKIYEYLRSSYNGEIAFIDELDSNLNTLYLMKILECMSNNKNGQLIFTIHNLEPMNEIRKAKNGLDFMNDNYEIVTWIKNGCSSPIKQYEEGLIEGIPFNIDWFDFAKCFSKGKTE